MFKILAPLLVLLFVLLIHTTEPFETYKYTVDCSTGAVIRTDMAGNSSNAGDGYKAQITGSITNPNGTTVGVVQDACKGWYTNDSGVWSNGNTQDSQSRNTNVSNTNTSTGGPGYDSAEVSLDANRQGNPTVTSNTINMPTVIIYSLIITAVFAGLIMLGYAGMARMSRTNTTTR
jgi:activator of HSP90 ATPase